MEAYTLAKPSAGEILTFFYGSGLNFKSKEETRALLPEAMDDFDLAMDENDVIHIVCQDTAGNLNYIFCEGGTWQKQVILESKNQEAYHKNLALSRIGAFNNVFYILEHEGRHMLVHHILGRPPEVVDYIYQGVEDVVLYQKQKFFAFYREGQGQTLCCRRYDWNRKSWGEKQPLDLIDVAFVKALCRGDVFYVVYQQKNHLYFQKYETFDGMVLMPAGNRILLTEDSRIRDCVLVDSEHDLYVLWNGENGPCTAVSSNGGKTFDVPRKLPYARYTALYRLRAFEDGSLRSDTYGYTLSGKLNLLAHDRFLIPEVSRREVTVVSQTHEVERFAGIAAEPAAADPVPEGMKIEINKLRIRLEGTERQMKEMLQQYTALQAEMELLQIQWQEKFERLEASAEPSPEENDEHTRAEAAGCSEEDTVHGEITEETEACLTEAMKQVEPEPEAGDVQGDASEISEDSHPLQDAMAGFGEIDLDDVDVSGGSRSGSPE